MARYDFKFGDTWISEFGAVCTDEPPIEIAQRDIALIDIPGKDGSDCIDNGRYLNVEMSRTIALVGRKASTANEKAIQLVNSFAYLHGYQAFEDTHHNGLTTEAVLVNFEDVIRSLRTMKTATLKFSRKPYWYLKDALEQQDIGYASVSSGSGFDVSIVNPFPSDACPSIVYEINTSPYSADFSLNITFTVSSTYNGVYSTKSYTMSNLTGNYNHRFLEVDLENQRVFSRSENGEIYKFCDCTIPTNLGTGESVLHFTKKNDIKNITLAPKWRCL